MTNTFLNKLIKHDKQRVSFSDEELIKQGMAPLLASTNSSLIVHKANLLEQVKFKKWCTKACEIFDTFDDNNIQFIIFKGFAFSHQFYNSSHLRPFADIDILVSKKHYKHAENLLITLGYQKYPSRQGQLVSFQNSFFDTDSPKAVIDLHWEINNRIEFHQNFSFNTLMNNSIKIGNFYTLCKPHGFILGCFHYIAHRPEDRKQIWLYDLALIWESMNNELQNTTLKIAQEKNQAKIVSHLLNNLYSTFPGCFSKEYRSIETSFESTQDYTFDRKSKISDIKIRLKNIKGIQNKLLFFSEYIFQKPEYVKSRYNINSTYFIWIYYPRMWLEDIIKLFK